MHLASLAYVLTLSSTLHVVLLMLHSILLPFALRFWPWQAAFALSQGDRCAVDVERIRDVAGHELLRALCLESVPICACEMLQEASRGPIQDRFSLWVFRCMH